MRWGKGSARSKSVVDDGEGAYPLSPRLLLSSSRQRGYIAARVMAVHLLTAPSPRMKRGSAAPVPGSQPATSKHHPASQTLDARCREHDKVGGRIPTLTPHSFVIFAQANIQSGTCDGVDMFRWFQSHRKSARKTCREKQMKRC